MYSRAAGLPLALALAGTLGLTGCSGDDSSAREDETPTEVLSAAASALDATSGVNLTLSSDDLPPGVTGITGAAGVATNAPAFEGTITVVISGQSVDVPVVAVDDVVHAQIPFTQGWQEVDPADYGAPDPAQLINSETGFSSLLKITSELEEGESVRGGADNAEVLTSYTGTVPATR